VLRQRSLDEAGDVGRSVADRLQPVGHAEPLHEPGDAVRENRSGVGVLRTSHAGAERLGRLQMPRGIGDRRESEDGGRIEDHRDPVWDERVIAGVTSAAPALEREFVVVVSHRCTHHLEGVSPPIHAGNACRAVPRHELVR